MVEGIQKWVDSSHFISCSITFLLVVIEKVRSAELLVLGLKMFLKKLTQEQRIRLRAQRKESQLIRNRAKERSEGKY